MAPQKWYFSAMIIIVISMQQYNEKIKDNLQQCFKETCTICDGRAQGGRWGRGIGILFYVVPMEIEIDRSSATFLEDLNKKI